MAANKKALVKNAMLAVQRYPWEQGVAMQAILESGDLITAGAMAHEAVLRQEKDGRLASMGNNIGVTDPSSCGETVLKTGELTGDLKYKEAAEKQLHYLMHIAQRTDNGTLVHNEYKEAQIWSDSLFMAPPFLAVMGEVEEAERQINGMMGYLLDPETGVLFHMYDAGTKEFLRKKLWATGNGWALMGIGKVIDEAMTKGYQDIAERLIRKSTALLDSFVKYQLPDGRFHDIVDDPDTFIDGASAMMMAVYIYRGIVHGWLDRSYQPYADQVAETMEQYVDNLGIIHEVCGAPQFLYSGTSAESMAAYIMMHNWKEQL